MDFAICATSPLSDDEPPIESFGWHVLSDRDTDISKGAPLSIIHHPDGKRKSITVHNSHFMDAERGVHEERYCWYSGDTRGGSSGAPVFDPNWSAIALHQAAVPKRDENRRILSKDGTPIIIGGKPVTELDQLSDFSKVAIRANEGTQTSRIANRIMAQEMENKAHETIRKELISMWLSPGARHKSRRASVKGVST
jgi:endonuclease G